MINLTKIIKTIQFQMLQNLQEPHHILGMKTNNYLLTNHIFFLLMIYTMNEKEEITKEACEQEFGTAYETYRQIVT